MKIVWSPFGYLSILPQLHHIMTVRGLVDHRAETAETMSFSMSPTELNDQFFAWGWFELVPGGHPGISNTMAVCLTSHCLPWLRLADCMSSPNHVICKNCLSVFKCHERQIISMDIHFCGKTNGLAALWEFCPKIWIACIDDKIWDTVMYWNVDSFAVPLFAIPGLWQPILDLCQFHFLGRCKVCPPSNGHTRPFFLQMQWAVLFFSIVWLKLLTCQ